MPKRLRTNKASRKRKTPQPKAERSSVAGYRVVQDYIRDKISSGEWLPDQRIPSEHELTKHFGVSRVTIHRAVRELAMEGLISRIRGSGSFVGSRPKYTSILELRNIQEEIASRGNRHSTEIHCLRRFRANSAEASSFRINAGDLLFHCVLVHKENDIPVQLEDRYVNANLAPNFLDEDYSKITPYDHLRKNVPADKAEHIVEAALPDADTQERLGIDSMTPCLVLHRTTSFRGVVATKATLIYPGPRYKLGGVFRPTSGVKTFTDDDQ